MKFRDIKSKMDPERARRIEDHAREELKSIHLGWLRTAAAKTQAEIASTLGISQAAVSSLEGRDDLLLSTLRKYVSAIGGTVKIAIDLPGGRFRFDSVSEAVTTDAHEPRPQIYATCKSLECISKGQTSFYAIVDDGAIGRPRARPVTKVHQADAAKPVFSTAPHEVDDAEAAFA